MLGLVNGFEKIAAHMKISVLNRVNIKATNVTTKLTFKNTIMINLVCFFN